MTRTEAVSPEGSSSRFEASALEAELARPNPLRWIGWRLRLLVAVALLGCVGIFALMRYVAATPTLDAVWRSDPAGLLVLVSSGDAALQPHVGRVLLSIVSADSKVRSIDGASLQRSPRWTVDGPQRAKVIAAHRWLAEAFSQGPMLLQFDNGETAKVTPGPRGVAGLGLLFWPLAAIALLLYLIGAIVWLVKPQARNLLYLVIAFCQAGNLLFIALETARGLGLPDGVASQDLGLRMGLDLVSAAAIVHAMTLHPTRLRAGAWLAAIGWTLALLLAWLAYGERFEGVWWWAQGGVIALGLGAVAVLSWSHRVQPNPFAVVMRRFGLVTVGSLLLLTVALGAAGGAPGIQHRVAEVGSVVWYLFFASLLLLVPFLSRSRQLLREFALLAGISTVATSLDLLFVAVFSLGQFASVTLSVFLALGVYAGTRQWILNQLTGSTFITLERSFEALYRTAREVEAHPERHAAMLLQLLRELFEPLEVLRVDKKFRRARVVGDGSALLVPVPRRTDAEAVDGDTPQAWVLRFGQRGKRIFTEADARLADRLAEQLKRAVAYDKAVERGRSEERLRIAQDLHDDIGARLLTLMYQAQSPEMEDYIRHTLQDLKTLTRGLAARDHRLSHALAEWKADIGQRLAAARIELNWNFGYDHDMKLSVVQWSALTRILRELVTNAIYHAKATRLDITAQIQDGRLTLSVSDDGQGGDPAGWSHGLGLGGVRKRVKQLGGSVHWRRHEPRGIVCDVVIQSLTDPPPPLPDPAQTLPPTTIRRPGG